MADDDHPLVKTLPPAMDYVNYLIVVEHNLSIENLPVLHQVLQDQKLTTNIGWDLIHLLLPLLPAAEECLQDIARLGNPREVVLKVTESLRMLEFDHVRDNSDSEADAAEALDNLQLSQRQKSSDDPASPTSATVPTRPLQVLQFQTLLNMLSIVHPRIKTKSPSRFLSTTLQGVLACYSQAGTHMDELTAAIVTFIKTNSGTTRPHLPPRTSSSMLSKFTSKQSAPDPEAQEESVSREEKVLENRLMQSFITHVLEEYLTSFTSADDVPGLAWSSRLMEKLHPERNVPQRATFAERFSTAEPLQARSALTGQLVALAQDLRLESEDLFAAMTDPRSELASSTLEEDDPPASADEIPLSKTGALYLFTARKVSELLYATPATTPTISIFPTHATLLINFLHDAGPGGPSAIGSEREATIDAILALGLVSLEADNVGEPADDDAFTSYLQTTSLLSANAPSPTLRFHAHYLTATVLRAHPSDVVRLAFIRDTLENCPYPNLRASAVGWLKGEIVEANPSTSASSSSEQAKTATSPTTAVLEGEQPHSIFATPVALASVAPSLFPALTPTTTDLLRDNDDAETTESAAALRTHYAQEASFLLAALNFYLLLLLAPQPLREALNLRGLRERVNIDEGFVKGLKRVAGRLGTVVKQFGGDDEQERQEMRMDAALLEGVLDRVEEMAKKV